MATKRAAFTSASVSSRANLAQVPRRKALHRCCASKGDGVQPPYNVLITGSTKGIGLALARKHLTEGDNVIICSRKDDNVKAALKELRGEFGKQRVSGMACNVCKPGDVAALVERAKSDLGRIDVWVNNAGTNAYSFRPLIESSESDLIEIVDTNVLGTMLCCQAAIKLMREQANGGHIFIMEGAGSDGNPTPRFAAYGATKRSLSQFSKSLQRRRCVDMQAEIKAMGASNIGVHLVSPGMVTTDLLMSGADTTQSKFFINCMAEPPETVADFLVPKIRDVPRKRSTGTAIKFLTPSKAYGNILQRLIMGKNKGRYVAED